MNFSRQAEVFEPYNFNTPVHIIGAGATGSWVALFLAKLGIENITVWDFDKVEEHNLPNQAFRVDDIGCEKVSSTQRQCSDFSGITIEGKNAKVDGTQRLDGIVFMLTDTMSSREEIYKKAIRLKPHVKLLIETRMGLEGGRVYTVNPIKLSELSKYEATLYKDEEASVSACGASQSIVATAVQIASMAVWQLIKWHNKDEDIANEILVDSRNNTVIPTVWE